MNIDLDVNGRRRFALVLDAEDLSVTLIYGRGTSIANVISLFVLVLKLGPPWLELVRGLYRIEDVIAWAE